MSVPPITTTVRPSVEGHADAEVHDSLAPVIVVMASGNRGSPLIRHRVRPDVIPRAALHRIRSPRRPGPSNILPYLLEVRNPPRRLSRRSRNEFPVPAGAMNIARSRVSSRSKLSSQATRPLAPGAGSGSRSHELDREEENSKSRYHQIPPDTPSMREAWFFTMPPKPGEPSRSLQSFARVFNHFP